MGSLGARSTRQIVESDHQVTKCHWLMQKDSLVGAQSYGEKNGQKLSGGLLRNSYPQSQVSLQLQWEESVNAYHDVEND